MNEQPVTGLVEEIQGNQLRSDAEGVIHLFGSNRGNISITYEAYAEDSGGLAMVMSDRIEPIHAAFAADLAEAGVDIELTGNWEVNTEDSYPVFHFPTRVLRHSVCQPLLAALYDELEICGKIEHGVELSWNGWLILDYTCIKTNEPEIELTLEEQVKYAMDGLDRWKAECDQRVTELEELHARIRKIKSCPRYRLGESSLGPPMFAHGRGEWIKHEDMRNAAALPITDEQKELHEKLDADRDERRLPETPEPMVITDPNIMWADENETMP